MEEYITTLLEQIRCKKARIFVEQEIRNHIEDQIADNKAQGMEQQEAVRQAVKDMGDPVEAGVSLDRIHRPQIAWSMIVLMAVVSLLSLLLHIAIGRGAEEVSAYTGNAYIQRIIRHIVIGFVIMLAVYRLDYSVIAKYAKIVAAVFLGFLFIHVFYTGGTINGAKTWIWIGGRSISVTYLMFLYIPLYGALLYQYRGKGYRGILKAIIWMLIPAWFIFRIPCLSIAMQSFFMMSVLLSIAIWKGWFGTGRKGILLIYWSIVVLIPVITVTAGMKSGMFATYQIVRIKAFLGGIPSDFNYVSDRIKEYMAASRMFGNSGLEVVGYLPEYNSAYLLTFLFSYYGIAAAILVCCLLGFLVIKIFKISRNQKNQLGMMMGYGCGLVFLTAGALNIAENMALFLPTETFFPFFSYGGSGMVVCYILVGIILSIYRYKNILSSHDSVSKKAAQPVKNKEKTIHFKKWGYVCNIFFEKIE